MTDHDSFDHDVAVNGVVLAVEEFGERDAPTIVLVSGGASSRDWWDEELCRLLAAGDERGSRRVIRYDLRDTGRSTTVPPGEATYTGIDLVDDLAGLLEATGAAPAHVVGLSLGGGLAQELALRRPELLATIALMTTTPARPLGPGAEPLPPPEPRVMEAFDPDERTDWDDPVAVGDAVVRAERLLSGTIPVDESRVRRIAAASVERSASPASADNHWMIGDGAASEAGLTDIRTPTLVMHGSLDPLFPLPHAEALARAIPGARLVVVPGMGHQFPPPETWPLVVRELLRHSAGS